LGIGEKKGRTAITFTRVTIRVKDPLLFPLFSRLLQHLKHDIEQAVTDPLFVGTFKVELDLEVCRVVAVFVDFRVSGKVGALAVVAMLADGGDSFVGVLAAPILLCFPRSKFVSVYNRR